MPVEYLFLLQMYIPSGGQIVTAADGTDPSGAGVITYIQPVNSLSGTQAQVLMAVAEDDGQGSQLHGKRSANASGLDGMMLQFSIIKTQMSPLTPSYVLTKRLILAIEPLPSKEGI